MPAWYGARRLLSLSNDAPIALWSASSLILPPFASETRASVANYFDSTGTIASASTDVARFDYTADGNATFNGWELESARTNGIRNGVLAGAAAGSPGTNPTNVTVSGLGTLTQTISTGTEFGMAYVGYRINGTTSTTAFIINLESPTQIAASNGQTWTGSFYARMVAGSLTNITTVQQGLTERTNIGGVAGQTIAPFTLSSSLTRSIATRVFNQATTNFTSSYAAITFSSGVAIDITMRIYAPQLEQGAAASSFITTSGAASTRSADVPAAASYTANPAIIQCRTIATGTRSRKVINPWSGFSSEIDEWIEAIAIYPMGTPSALLNSRLTVDGPW